MLSLTDLRRGTLLVLDGDPYQVVSAEFLRKQASRPVVRTTLKQIRSGQTLEHSFQQSDRIVEAQVVRAPAQFLYAANNLFIFMNPTSFEQLELSAQVVADALPYLVPEQLADIILFEGSPVSVELPIKVERKVIEAPPAVKGNTSTNVMKDVVVEGGMKVKAPLFIKADDIIRLDTRYGTYVERVTS